MCNTGSCGFERPNGSCSLSRCYWYMDYEDEQSYEDKVHALEDSIFDEYAHGELTVIQARHKLHERLGRL